MAMAGKKKGNVVMRFAGNFADSREIIEAKKKKEKTFFL